MYLIVYVMVNGAVTQMSDESLRRCLVSGWSGWGLGFRILITAVTVASLVVTVTMISSLPQTPQPYQQNIVPDMVQLYEL